MKRLAILFVLAAAVWGAYSFMPQQQDAQDQPSKTATNWPRLAPELLQRVEATSANATFSLRKEGGDWFVESPNTAPLRAERAKAEALANFFNANPPRRVLGGVDLSTAEQAKAYGLDAPVKRLTLADNATAYTLAFGAKNPGGDGVYASLSGGNATDLLLLGVNWLEQATGAGNYADLRLTDLLAQNIARIRVDNQDNPLELERSGPAAYKFVEPKAFGDYPVSSLDAERLLHEVAGLKGQLMPANAGAAVDNATPALELSLWSTGAQTPQRVRFFPVPGNHLQYLVQSDWQPAVLTVDRVALHKVAPDPFLLRDRRVLGFDPATVQRQELAFFAPDDLTPREVVLIRGNGTRPAEDLPSRDWTRQDSNATVPGLDMLLWQLSEIAFEADPVQTRPETAKDVLRWTLFDGQGAVLANATFAKDAGLLEGQSWLLATPRDGGEARLHPVASDVLERTLDAVFRGGKAADSF